MFGSGPPGAVLFGGALDGFSVPDGDDDVFSSGGAYFGGVYFGGAIASVGVEEVIPSGFYRLLPGAPNDLLLTSKYTGRLFRLSDEEEPVAVVPLDYFEIEALREAGYDIYFDLSTAPF